MLFRSIALLWWARPDRSGLTIIATMTIAMVVNILFAWSEVLHNSMLIRAAGLSVVNIGTRLTHSQQGGFASIILLLVIGWIGLLFVRDGGQSMASPTE